MSFPVEVICDVLPTSLVFCPSNEEHIGKREGFEWNLSRNNACTTDQYHREPPRVITTLFGTPIESSRIWKKSITWKEEYLTKEDNYPPR